MACLRGRLAKGWNSEAIEHLTGQWYVSACLEIGDKQRVAAGQVRIIAGTLQLDLAQLVGCRYIDAGAEADEERHGIGGQPLRSVSVEAHRIEAGGIVIGQCGHAGATLDAWNGNTIYIDGARPAKATESGFDLLSGNILALPAEGVTDTIDKVIVIVFIEADQ